MTTAQIVSLSVIVAAFVLFAAVLAWGDYQTRHITRRIRADQQRAAAGAKIAALQNAATAPQQQQKGVAAPTVSAT
jgi:uncharacterized protein HemX